MRYVLSVTVNSDTECAFIMHDHESMALTSPVFYVIDISALCCILS